MVTTKKTRKLPSLILLIPIAVCAQQNQPTTDIETGTQDSARIIEEVVITARRREESLQEVPVAITALSSQDLEEATVQTLSDLSRLAPGLRYSVEGGQISTNVSMRGLGKIPLGEGVPAVIVYFAETPIVGDGTNLPTYDLANIQVLKGPQGTLFGRNSLGGAILMTPKEPEYASGGYLEATLGDYGLREFEGAVNFSLIDELLALRIAAQIRERDGVTENLSGGPDFDDINQDSIRLSVLFEPTDWLSNTLIVEHFDAQEQPGGEILYDFHPGAFGPAAPLFGPPVEEYFLAQQRVGPHKAFSNLDNPHSDRRSTTYINTTRVQLTDDILLKNIFSFRETEVSTQINTSGTGPLVIPGLGELILFHANSSIDKSYLTNELQLQGNAFDDRLEWITGFFYAEDEPEGPMGGQFRIFDFLADGPDRNFSGVYVENKHRALFAQVALDISDWTVKGLKLNLGARYSWDEVSNCGGGNPTRFPTPDECEQIAALGLPDGTGIIKNKGEEPSWTIGLDWAVNDNLFLYIAHRRGYRGVGVNSPKFETNFTTGGEGCVLAGTPVTCPDLRPFQQTEAEKVEDFELGMKSDWLFGDVPIRLNLAAFYMSYTDSLQFFNVVNGSGIPSTAPDVPNRSSIGFNAGDIIIEGLELDTSISPVEGLTLSASAAYIDQEVDKLAVPAIGGASLSEDQVTLPTPEFSGTLGLRWVLPVRPLEADLVFNADYYYSKEWIAQSGVKLPSYDVTNARLDWRGIAGSGFDLGIWVRNVTDEEYPIAPTVLMPTFPVSTVFFGPPRTFGLSFRYRWGD